MDTSTLAQLFTGFGTLVTTLAGLFAYIASRVKRTQREQAAEIRALRRYAVEVARWGFEVRFAATRKGLAVPEMPRPPWETDGQDDEDEQGEDTEEADGERDDASAGGRSRHARRDRPPIAHPAPASDAPG